MSAPAVDVLAVMDEVAEFGVSTPKWYDMPAAHAAVAELIEAAEEALALLGDLDPRHGITAQLRAALARIGGES